MKAWRIGRASVVLISLALVVAAASTPSAQPVGRIQVHFINVGQADAALIMDDARQCVILIDAGDTRYPGSSQSFRNYLRQQLPFGSPIAVAIASHPHADHIGSMRWVLENYSVQTYIDSGHAYDSALYERLMDLVKLQATNTLKYLEYKRAASMSETICGAAGPRLKVLYPRQGLDAEVCESNPNDCSVVAKVKFGAASVLFPGDAEEEQEEQLLMDPDVKRELDSMVLKIGHHGSDTSTSEEFLQAVSPSLMVVSAGAKNIGTNKGYKHPRLSTVRHLLAFAGPREDVRSIDAYDAAKKKWTHTSIWGRLYVTARDGNVVFVSDGTTSLPVKVVAP
jgi:competence protein ComEC